MSKLHFYLSKRVERRSLISDISDIKNIKKKRNKLSYLNIKKCRKDNNIMTNITFN